jgi:branched-chain amino acid transport system substrate-binding protein
MRDGWRTGTVALTLAVAVSIFVSGCGGEREPVRIGVLADCVGFLASTRELTAAGSELPLLERGGAQTADGKASARVGGRRVELVPACTEVTYLHLLILATRRLVEVDHVDVVVGPIGPQESVVFRKLAARYPDVTFIAAHMGAQETTLRDPQPNVFRFTPAAPQISAGLGSYAFNELGWRRAVLVGDGFDPGSWELAAGFVAEFCALGGDVVERDWLTVSSPKPSKAARRHAEEADGVLLVSPPVALVSPLVVPIPYLTAYAAAAGRLPSRLLLAGTTFHNRKNLAPPGVDLDGVVVGGYIPIGDGGHGMRAFRASMAARFPELTTTRAEETVVVPVYTAVDAVATALERTDGELGHGQTRLRAALSKPLDAPQGTIRLDDDRQESGPIYLERIEARPRGGVTLGRVRTIPGVEQTYGGIFTAQSPSPLWDQPACKRATPPPWAR